MIQRKPGQQRRNAGSLVACTSALLGVLATSALHPAFGCNGPATGDLASMLDSRAARVGRTEKARQTQVVIPMHATRVEICDAGRLSLSTPVIDPRDRQRVTRRVPIEAVTTEAGRLILHVAGPVAEGSVLRLEARALAADDVVAMPGEVSLPGISAEEATFWFKALEPSLEGQSLLGSASYPGSLPIQAGTPQPSSPSASLAELRDHYASMIRAGFLAPARADELIELMRSILDGRADKQSRIFKAPAGSLDARLLAATLANAGTVLEGTIDTILAGKHAARKPIRVYVDDTAGQSPGPLALGTASANVWISNVVAIVLSRDTRLIPLPALATLIGHEAMHQDKSVGLSEELIASLAQFTAYAQHVLADPGITRWGTDAVRASNTRLVGLLNSGFYDYPAPGLGSSVLVQADGNVFPGSKTDWRSLSDLLRRRIYQSARDVPTPGNDLLDNFALRTTGIAHKGLIFSDVTVRKLAGSRALSWAQWVELAHILELRLPPETATGPAGASPARR